MSAGSTEIGRPISVARPLVAARLRHVAGTRWGLRRYMDMGRLREMDQPLTNGMTEISETTAAA